MFTPKKWMIEVVGDWNDIYVPEGIDLTEPEVFYSFFASIDACKYAGVSHAEYLDFVNMFASWIADPTAHDGLRFAVYMIQDFFK